MNRKQLYGLKVTQWARDLTTLKEVRDQQEIQSLSLIL